MKLKTFKFRVRKNEDKCSEGRKVFVTSKHLNGAFKKLFNEIDTTKELPVYFEEV